MSASRNLQDEWKSHEIPAKVKEPSTPNQEDVIIQSPHVTIDIDLAPNKNGDVKAELKELKEPLSHSIENFKHHLLQAIENKEFTEANLLAFFNTPEGRSVRKYLPAACGTLLIGLVASAAIGAARESIDDGMTGVSCTILASLVTSSPLWYKLFKHVWTLKSNIKTRPYTTLLPDDQKLIKSEGEKIGLIIEPSTTIENILDQVTLLEKDLTDKDLMQFFFTQADSKGIGHKSGSPSTKQSQAVFDDKQGVRPIIISYLFPPLVSDAAPPENNTGPLSRLRNYFR